MHAVDLLASSYHLIDTQDGLPDNNVHSIGQLPDKRMLIVTESSVCIFNGENVVQLKSPLSDALLVDEFCDQIASRKDGFCWIRLANQLKILNLSTEHFITNPREFLSREYGISKKIGNVFFDNEGGVYLLTANHRLFFLPSYHGLVPLTVPASFHPVQATQTTTSVCLLSSEGRILILDKKTFRKKRFCSVSQLLGDGRIYDFRQMTCVSQRNNVIFSVKVDDGKSILASLNVDRGTLNMTKTIGDIVCSMKIMRNDRLLVASQKMIYLFGRDGTLLSETRYCATPKGVFEVERPVLFADGDDGIWMALKKKGIVYTSSHSVRFKSLSGASLPCSDPDGQEVTAVVPYSGSQLLVAFKKGLWMYDMKRSHFMPVDGRCRGASAVSVTRSDHGRIWITLLSGETFVWEKGNPRPMSHRFVTDNGRMLGDICAVYDFENQGCYVVSKSLGVMLVTKNKMMGKDVNVVEQITKNKKMLFRTKNVTNAVRGLEGSVLFSTGWGMFVFHPQTRRIEFPVGVNQQFKITCGDLQFHDVKFDSRGWLWLGHLEGLTLYIKKRGLTFFYSKENGLPNNIIQSVIDCGPHKMCVGTSEGIALMRINDTDASHPVADIQPIGSECGLLEGEYSSHCAAKLADGTIVLGCIRGLSILPAGELNKRVQNEPPIFSVLRVRGEVSEAGDGILEKSVSCTSRLDLPYGSRSFSLSFASPNYANMGMTHYRYRLIHGYTDSPWIYLSSRHVAGEVSFQFLPAGHYRLEIQSSLLNSSWSRSAVMEIVVHSPWYWNFWSKSLYLLILLLVGYYDYTMRKQRAAMMVALRLQEERNKFTPEEEEFPKRTFNPRDLHLPTADEELMLRVMDKLESHLSDSDYGVEALSSDVGMARVTLYRKIKMITGQTPVSFIRTIRLKRSVQYLNAGKNVNETSFLVGFSDVAYFRKCFKDMYGSLPKSFEQQN